MAMVHLAIKFGANIFIQSGVTYIYPKFKMAAAAILDFTLGEFGTFHYVHSVLLEVCYKFGSTIC